VKSITIDGWVYELIRVTPSRSDSHLCDVAFEFEDATTDLWVATNSLEELIQHLETERAAELPKLKRHPAPGHLKLVTEKGLAL
jgi:hypothetical protein